ncbi:hypothetical protein GCM10009853_067000 [Glycomyces scopariae]
MATIESLTAALGTALDKARDLFAGLAGSRTQADSLHDQLRGLGFHRDAARSEGIASDLEAAQALTTALSDRLESALAAVESARTGSGVIGSGGSAPAMDARAVPDRPPWGDRPPVAGFTPLQPKRECFDAIRREGWPRNSEGLTSARGILYTDGGHRVNSETFRPYRPGASPPCDDLREPWRPDERYTTTWHVERDAAAAIRKWGLTTAVLYLNLPPCGKRSKDQRRCHENLASILPAGTTLYIWEIRENGAATRHVYSGDGKAIK